MSLQGFIDSLCEAPLTSKRLEEVWNSCNFKNKSQLINRLTKSLDKYLSDKQEISPEETIRLCNNFRNKLIRNKIKPVDPHLETPTISTIDPSFGINPATNIVFRPGTGKHKWIATCVVVGAKQYPLQRKHMVMCINNGWFFETSDSDISSPFLVKS